MILYGGKRKRILSRIFDNSDQREVYFIPGKVIQRDWKKRTLTASLNIETCKQMSIPLEYGRKFEKLAYASTTIHPDIVAAMSILSKFKTEPEKQQISPTL